jgi:cytoskeletal protein CcmA (bactofilin family)
LLMSVRELTEDTSFIQSPSRTVVLPGTSISGRLSFNLPVKIDSRFTGEVKASELLVVGPNAQVKANISARHLQIEGTLVGRVSVAGWIEILPGGHFEGEIESGQLRVYPGAVFEGKGNMVRGG